MYYIGPAYRKKVISMMCQTLTWKHCHLTPIAALFKDVALTSEEFDLIMAKICSGIKNLELQSLPPLVYQLLLLCKPYSFSGVLAALMDYFEDR